MRIGIIAEGRADIAVIKAVVKAITGIDGSDMYAIRPKEILDETDGEELKFSNWELVCSHAIMNNCLYLSLKPLMMKPF